MTSATTVASGPRARERHAEAALLALVRTGDVGAARARAADLALDPAHFAEGAVLLNLALFDRDHLRALGLRGAGARDWTPRGLRRNEAIAPTPAAAGRPARISGSS